MGKVFDPEIYRATEAHFAHHPMPAIYTDKWETWHNDAIFDNGYYSTVMFATNGPIILLDMHIIDPKGKEVVESMQFFEPGEYKVSTKTLDIKMGKNTYRGKFPKYHISVHDGNNGVELDYEAFVQSTISELPDGVGLGRVNTPDMPVFVSWFFRPRNKITGKLIIDGKEIPVTGEGWADHQWGNTDYFQTAVQYFFWGCLPLGEHTLNFFEIQLTEQGGYRPIKWLWDWKGDKLFEYCRDCDYYITASDIKEGDTVPRELFIVFEHDRIRGTIKCKLNTIIQKQVLELADRILTINRSSYDCHAQLEIDGENVDVKFKRIIEAGYGVVRVQEKTEEELPKKVVKATKYSQDSKLGDLLKDPEAKEILERFIPGISTSSQVKMGYGMSFKVICGFPQTGVSKEKLAAIDEELRTIE